MGNWWSAVSNWFTSMFSGKTSDGDAVSASTFNVTKIVSIFVAFFAGLTQGAEIGWFRWAEHNTNGHDLARVRGARGSARDH
jgi:hypothetical protein